MKNEKLRVPKLRFKGFSGEWEEKRLFNIGKITTGSTPPTSIKEYYNGNKLFVSPADIKNNRYIEETKTTLTELGFSKGRIVEKNSVCFVCIGSTIGKVAQLNIDSITNQQINCIYANKYNSNDFIYSLLEYKAPKIKLLAGEQAVPQINKTDFSNLKFALPKKQEQEKIASFLSSIDKKINQLSKKDELLQNYKKSMMQKIFLQKLRFKKADGSDYPKWEEKKLGEITYKVSRKNKDNISYPVYSINNKEGFVPQSEQFEGMDSNSRNYDISLYKIIDKNTFAYNPARINVGSLGYSNQLKDIIISSLYVCFKTNDDINDNFLLQYFTTFEFNKSVLRNTEGGVRDYLFYENFSNIKINLPSLEEQTKIANFLSSLDTKISQNRKALEKTQKFKKALLQKMFV